MAESAPLLGVMREVEHPETCPTCGVKVESATFGMLADAMDESQVRTSPAALLVPCGHRNV